MEGAREITEHKGKFLQHAVKRHRRVLWIPRHVDYPPMSFDRVRKVSKR